VWGSYYNDLLGWGFGCCHTTTKNSMCSGEKGKKEALMREVRKKIIKRFKIIICMV